jgi:outer membrane lipoprotein-sorting protein
VTLTTVLRPPAASTCVAVLALLLALATLAVAAVDPAIADSVNAGVPLPHLRPSGAAPFGIGGPTPGNAADAATAVAHPPVSPTYNPNSPFTPDQQIALANVTAYFNSFSLMEGNFVQIGPNGEQSEGVFFISRPGKIRFHYNPPARLDVIADGSSVAVKDGRAGTQDLYPLSKTPLRYLLASQVDLTSPALVNAVQVAADLVTVTIVQTSAFADGKLTLIFDRKTSALRQWQVSDAQGLTTSVAIFNIVIGKPQDTNLVRINVNSNAGTLRP